MHPMYEQPAKKGPTTDLFQGDIICRKTLAETGALDGHQEYMRDREDFPGFCIVTQSCDLAHSEGRYAVDFITLAVIRKVIDACDPDENKLKRMITHTNDDKTGHFYLHPDRDVGIDEECVVDLRTMMALRSTMHYPEILKARKMSMSEVYAAKMGWMMGYLFSRVPLAPCGHLESQSDEIVKRLLTAIKKRGPKLLNELPATKLATRSGAHS